MSDRRAHNPYRVDKRCFRQEHVTAALRRAVRQSAGAPWPLTTPAATARPGAATAGAKGSEAAR